MVNKKQTTVSIDKEQHEALLNIRDVDGVSITFSVRRAIAEYLLRRKKKETENKRASD